MYKRFIILLCSALFYSCEEETLKVDISEVEVQTSFKRFEQAFFETDTLNFENELNDLRNEFAPFFLAGNTMENWEFQRKEEQQNLLYRDAMRVFGDMKSYNEDLNIAMKYFYHYFPDVPKIHYYTYISNLDFNYPILYADTLCFAAIDLYLGPEKPYYDYLPEYLAYYRQPQFLVRDCMEGLAQQMTPPAETEGSLLEQMIHHGKLLYFLEAMMPYKDKHIIIKYTPKDIEFCNANEKNIWSYFIENNLLFSSQNELSKRFIDPAPFSKFGTKMDIETPGRIGQWLGWQIVRSFAQQHPDMDLREILQMKDAREILKQSRYKP